MSMEIRSNNTNNVQYSIRIFSMWISSGRTTIITMRKSIYRIKFDCLLIWARLKTFDQFNTRWRHVYFRFIVVHHRLYEINWYHFTWITNCYPFHSMTIIPVNKRDEKKMKWTSFPSLTIDFIENTISPAIWNETLYYKWSHIQNESLVPPGGSRLKMKRKTKMNYICLCWIGNPLCQYSIPIWKMNAAVYIRIASRLN